MLAAAELAERPHMMEQVQTILATFDLSRSHSRNGVTHEAG